MLGSSILEALRRAVAGLEARGAKYALVGGLAGTLRGRVRTTRDCDLLVLADEDAVASLREEFRERGFAHLDRADRHRLEDVTLLRFWFPVEESGFSLSVDVQLGSTAFHREVVEGAEALEFAGVQVRVARREDLVLLKLASWRPIDRADAIELAAGTVDWSALEGRATRLGVKDRLTEVQEALGEVRAGEDAD